jgi:hypothetical protein
MCCITGILTWDKVCHIGKYIHHQKYGITPSFFLGSPNKKSMLIASQGLSGMGNG